PMNPLTNELGRQAVLRRYQEDGRYFATVELVEGNRPSDTRVVYQIVEGPVVKVTGVQFKGNSFADSARLRTVLMTRRQFAGFFGGKFNPMTLEMDRQRLTEYYQGLGFVAAQVTPEVVRTEDPGHVTVVYHVVEGQRYQVADLQIDGAKSLPAATLQQMTEQKVGKWYDR